MQAHNELHLTYIYTHTPYRQLHIIYMYICTNSILNSVQHLCILFCQSFKYTLIVHIESVSSFAFKVLTKVMGPGPLFANKELRVCSIQDEFWTLPN